MSFDDVDSFTFVDIYDIVLTFVTFDIVHLTVDMLTVFDIVDMWHLAFFYIWHLAFDMLHV